MSGSTDELELKARVDDPATLSLRGGHKHREEQETRLADAETARAILEHLGYEVVMRILPEGLGYFVAAYERRTGRPARIAAS